ncbi:MAG: hypothetical protein HY048_05715 [Acidobacteria bacterium]|nr:hypothetical protein [Acidobacteriota bacterium]
MHRASHTALGLALAAALGWTGIIDRSGHCYYAVPSDWQVIDASETIEALATSRDGRASASSIWSAYASWAAFTVRLRLDLQPTIVHKDDGQRFWVEYGRQPGVHHFSAVAAPLGGCTLHLDLNRGADDALAAIAREVIGSLVVLR